MLSAAKLVSYITCEEGRPHEVCVTDGRYYTSILKEIYGIVLSNQIMSVYRFGYAGASSKRVSDKGSLSYVHLTSRKITSSQNKCNFSLFFGKR